MNYVKKTFLMFFIMAAVTFSAAALSEELKPDSYVVGEIDGCVGVLLNGEAEIETDLPVSTLRRADRDMLENGIAVPSREKALMILEDLGA